MYDNSFPVTYPTGWQMAPGRPPMMGELQPVANTGAVSLHSPVYVQLEPKDDLGMYTSPPQDTKDLHLHMKEGSKPHSTPMTLKWLGENYEIAEGVCIPRNTLYLHYSDFCEKHDITPVNAASFGKIIRQQFPQITTRRLGTRGQSKYHYYGIGVRESSPYYDYIYSKAGLQSMNNGKKDAAKQLIPPYSPRSKIGTLLPEFPKITDVKLPKDVSEDKVLTFVMMYRTHCQRILDTVIRANFDEVQNFLLHFWQGMPPHMVPILGTASIVGLVAVCDSILYKAISNVLMPSVLQALPESLTQVIKKFSKNLPSWIHMALLDLPQAVRSMKLKVARNFTAILTLQMSLNHLCQASRTVIHSNDIMGQMCEDWGRIDKVTICHQTMYSVEQPIASREIGRMAQAYHEFQSLLQDQAPIETYIEWLDKLIEFCVEKPSKRNPGKLRSISRNFLLVWTSFGTKVIRDMTLQSAQSFGSFHLLHLMFDDYVKLRLEMLYCQEISDNILQKIQGEATIEVIEEIMLSSSLGLSSPDLDPTSPIGTFQDYITADQAYAVEQKPAISNHRTQHLGQSLEAMYDRSPRMVADHSPPQHDHSAGGYYRTGCTTSVPVSAQCHQPQMTDQTWVTHGGQAQGVMMHPGQQYAYISQSIPSQSVIYPGFCPTPVAAQPTMPNGAYERAPILLSSQYQAYPAPPPSAEYYTTEAEQKGGTKRGPPTNLSEMDAPSAKTMHQSSSPAGVPVTFIDTTHPVAYPMSSV